MSINSVTGPYTSYACMTPGCAQTMYNVGQTYVPTQSSCTPTLYAPMMSMPMSCSPMSCSPATFTATSCPMGSMSALTASYAMSSGCNSCQR